MTTTTESPVASPFAEQYMAPVIEKMANHLAAQRRPSRISGGAASCAYRGVGQTSCAVGCLFSDEAYEKAGEPENLDVYQLLDTYEGDPIRDEVMAWKPQGMEDFDFFAALSRAQNYHDGSDLVSIHYETRLDEFEGKPDAELAAAITADLNAIVTKLWEDAQ